MSEIWIDNSWVVLTNQGTEIERSQFLDHDRVGWLVSLKDLFRERERERERERCVLVSISEEGRLCTYLVWYESVEFVSLHPGLDELLPRLTPRLSSHQGLCLGQEIGQQNL